MKLLVKYFKHFGFVNRVVWLTVKYNVLYVISGNKKLLDYILYNNSRANLGNSERRNTKDFILIERRIDQILFFWPLLKTCLIRSMIKTTFFRNRFNYLIPINLGVSIQENNLSAHSWIFKDEIVINGKYFKVN